MENPIDEPRIIDCDEIDYKEIIDTSISDEYLGLLQSEDINISSQKSIADYIIDQLREETVYDTAREGSIKTTSTTYNDVPYTRKTTSKYYIDPVVGSPVINLDDVKASLSKIENDLDIANACLDELMQNDMPDLIAETHSITGDNKLLCYKMDRTCCYILARIQKIEADSEQRHRELLTRVQKNESSLSYIIQLLEKMTSDVDDSQ